MARGEDGYNAWLRYARLPDSLLAGARWHSSVIILSGNIEASSPLLTASRELQTGIDGILGQSVNVQFKEADPHSWTASCVIVGPSSAFAAADINSPQIQALKSEGFALLAQSPAQPVCIIGHDDRGCLYGVFDYLMKLAQGHLFPEEYIANPSAPIRSSDHWDNLDGTIERGYAGPSIFFSKAEVVQDLSRVAQLARMMASIRLNVIVVNNVNAHSNLLSPTNLQGLGRIADTMRPYGIRIGVALYFDAPKQLGGLRTADPLDEDVIAWWNKITEDLVHHVPDLFGYLIKANSEGQPGPLTYGRTLADAANMFARALKRVGDGIVLYRAFVYNHHLDESDRKNDRAKAAVEYFQHLDGDFDDNVVIQPKFGPIDFQVREPPSPLLASLRRTNVVIEFQVCQEYLGQQSHYVYQAPLWKTILDFDMRVDGKPSLVRDIVSGQQFNRKQSGYAAVVNTGSDSTWLGHHLSMSNLYAYGRLAWDPTLDPVDIIQDWTRLTLSLDERVVKVVTDISMQSWPVYEDYSGNLGVQTLCDIIYTHYGPSPGSQDGNGWGQWTRADAKAIGMDRTLATGTGFAAQYPSEVAARFEKIETTPEELLLWFHHVPYTHRLKSGKTVIQTFYDSHYSGAEMAQTFPQKWAELKGLIDEARFEHVAFRLAYQAGHAIVWRDSVNNFYHAKSGLADEQGRVGNHPWRIEAKSMEREGYVIVDVLPSEAASGGRAIVTASNTISGTASMRIKHASGIYKVVVGYYDHLGGRSSYQLLLNDTLIGTWRGDLIDKLKHDFSAHLDGHSATRVTFPNINIHTDDVLKIVGQSDGLERAPLDYVAILPEGVVD